MLKDTLNHLRKNINLSSKSVAIFIYLSISIGFTTYLMVTLGDTFISNLLWVALGIALELTNVYLTALAKLVIKEKSSLFSKISKLIALAIPLSILIFVSMSASLGFTSSTIENKNNEIKMATNLFIETRDSLQRDIDSLNDRIILNEDRMRRLDGTDELEQEEYAKFIEENGYNAWAMGTIQEDEDSSVATFNEYEMKIEELKSQRNIITNNKLTLIHEFNNEISSSQIFDLIAKYLPFSESTNFSVSGDDFKQFFFLILIIAIQMGIIILTPPLSIPVMINNSPEDIKKYQQKFMTYIDSLLDVDGIRLNGDERISEATGLDIKDCKEFKKLLQTITIDGEPLIKSDRGGSKAGFSNEIIKKAVLSRTKLGSGGVN